MTNEQAIEQAASAVKQADKIAVLTGAGVSKESGVPTFRDAQTGLWAQYDPQQLATPRAFQQDPKLVWEWYEFRRSIVREAKPNPGHAALAALQQRYPSTTIITQNIDDLHEQAGSHDVIHLHGNIAQTKCFGNCQGSPTLVDLAGVASAPDDTPPRCPHCGNFLRPDVVWFGESLPTIQLQRAMNTSRSCDVMLVVGTSGLVHPVASLPIHAYQNGVTIIEVNPDYTALSRIATVRLDGPSGELLPELIEQLDHVS
jgi:NAD-dependent deacetylase